MAEKVTISQLRQMLVGLSSFGTAMSELERLSDHQKLLSTDLFTVARQCQPNSFTGQDHKNVNMKYSSLSVKFLQKFKTDDITANGNWTFGTNLGSNLRCTAELDPWKKSHPETDNLTNYGVVTIGYYKEYFSNMVKELSAMYYDYKSTEPAYRFASNDGDIITTNSKRTSLDAYSFRASTTSWTKIHNTGNTAAFGANVMVLGVGACEANNFTRFGDCKAGEIGPGSEGGTGGEYTSIIDLAHFPNHSHKFRADNVSFTMTFRIRGTVAPIVADSAMATLSQYPYSKGKNALKPAFHGKTGTLTPLRMSGSTWLSSTQWKGVIEVADIVCHPDTGQEVAAADEYSSHNNVPPVIFLFLHERDGSCPVR